MVRPQVSVVMPIYNGDLYVREALEKVCAQSIENIEILCIDDGSHDSTSDIISQLSVHDKRIKLLRQDNAGASRARNRGIDVAKGDYLTFLDVDDWYDTPKYLDLLFQGLHASGMMVAAASFLNWRGKDNIESDFSKSPYFAGYSFAQTGPIQFKDYQFDYGFHRFLFSRNLFEQGAHRFPSLCFFEDPVFLVRILYQVKAFYAVKEAGYCYRCKNDPSSWNTAQMLDLLEGVRQNLLFSAQHNLAKLHWYTAHHLDAQTGNAGVGVNKRLDNALVEQKLRQVEAVLNLSYLEALDPADKGFSFELRERFREHALRTPLQKVRLKLGHALRHRR